MITNLMANIQNKNLEILTKENNIIKNQKENKKNLQDSNYFNSYLAGLFESDGYIQISRNKGSIRTFIVGITFALKDLPLCDHLKILIGYGARIRIKQEDNACVLIISNQKGLIRFVEIINGYLRSPKIYRFNLLIDYLNNKFNLCIYKHQIDCSDLGSNSWLAGFIDGDGGFYIRYSDPNKSLNFSKKKFFRIACSLTIEQRMIDTISNLSYENLFLEISKFLNCKLEISTHNVDKNYFKIRAYNQISLKIILNYFDKFSLYSSKYLDYKDWRKVVESLLVKTAYLSENKLIIFYHKNNMNSKRTYFNWDHLKSLII